MSDSEDIVNRRIQISKLIIDGLKPNEIKTKLINVPIEVIYNDIKHIKKKSLSTMSKLSKDGLAFNYDNMIQQMDLIYSESRQRLKDKELSTMEFIQLSKLNRETITEKRELLKESLSIFEIEKLKQDVKALKEQQDTPIHNSFMNQNLPNIKHNNILTK